jgi:hypothetical protein
VTLGIVAIPPVARWCGNSIDTPVVRYPYSWATRPGGTLLADIEDLWLGSLLASSRFLDVAHFLEDASALKLVTSLKYISSVEHIDVVPKRVKTLEVIASFEPIGVIEHIKVSAAASSSA